MGSAVQYSVAAQKLARHMHEPVSLANTGQHTLAKETNMEALILLQAQEIKFYLALKY